MSWDAEVRPLAPCSHEGMWALARLSANIPEDWPWHNAVDGRRHVGGCETALATVGLRYRGYDEEEADDHPGWVVTVCCDLHPEMVQRVERVVWLLMVELSYLGIPSEWHDPQAWTWDTHLPAIEGSDR